MRWTVALGVVAVTAALAVASEYLIRLGQPIFAELVMYTWLTLAAGALCGLIWLYFQITLGPRVTVSERMASRLERDLARARAGKGARWKRKTKKLAAQAEVLSKKINPAAEARAVFLRRVRLANSVLALICVLSVSFWIFAALAPQVWPSQQWFVDAHAPDAYHAALFSVDQVLRGTLFDLFDVFDWRISNTHNNPDNKWFSAFIVIYRFLMSGALFAAIAVRLGMREDWHEKAARETAEQMQARLARLADDAAPAR